MPRLPLLTILGFTLTVPAVAQTALLAKYNGQMHLVHHLRDMQPYVDDHGRFVAASRTEFALSNLDDYLPVFVSVRHLDVSTHVVEFVGSGQQINHEFWFRAEFDSPYVLDDVFLGLTLHLEGGQNTIFVHEIGRLEPGRGRDVRLQVPLTGPMGAGRYDLHVYVGGREVFNSEQPFAYREAMLDRMIAKRIVGRPDGPPQLVIGPAPDLPAKLLKARPSGKVTLRAHIGVNGAVINPVVVSASASEFAEPALAAIRQWRFLPRIKDGRPVDTTVDIPVDFGPRAAETKP